MKWDRIRGARVFLGPEMQSLLAPPLLASLLLVGLTARAQAPAERGERRMEAIRVEQGPRVDGVLDDDVWRRIPFTSDFMQKEPDQGKPASLRTEVAIVYDAEALYVGARMASDKPEDIETVMTRRDESGSAERFILSLDTYRDRRTAYSFAVTAAGVRVDWYHPQDDEYTRDSSYSPVWQARTTQTAEGWVAEFRIPFSQLRFSKAAEQVWGVNFNRYIPRRNEDDFWVVVPRDVTGWSSHFGELTGIRGVAPSRRVELVPYVSGDLQANSGANPRAGTPFESRRPYSGRAGLDAKVGLGPNLTLDATVNPDFGQLDADPAQVNLTAFETFLEERRPFFSEGSQLFSNDEYGPVWFYSRRIGGPPRLSAEADFVESPRASTIWGAAKLTGRLSSGLSLGALGAFTGDAFADTYDFATGTQDRVKLDSRTGFGVLRAQQELGDGGSVVGATLTTMQRGIGEARLLTRELAREAYSGGADFRLRLLGGEYFLSGFAGGSLVRGDPAAILRLQESSARYFQRPDQRYVRVSPEATALSGYTLGAKMERVSGEHWLWSISAGAVSPGFELNDMGRLNTADDIDVDVGLTYRETDPGRFLRNWELTLSAFTNWNYGLTRQSSSLSLNGSVTFPNFWAGEFRATYMPRALSDSLTRGGPLMQSAQGLDTEFTLTNSYSDTTRWTVGGGAWTYESGSRGGFVTASLTLQPHRRLRLGIEPNASLYTDGMQYVDTLEGGRAETYGHRYIFGSVQRREVALRLRANLFLTPDLSLEAYAEPFASSGTFGSFGELERAGGRSLRRYGSFTRLADGGLEVADGDSSFQLYDPDFNIRSFRSNVVLRWEWRPGSTLFLVWQQDRYMGLARGNPLAPRSLGDALSSPGGHTFALKLNWWFPAG
ncbi:carbohydrate binding family 9 domain-containing protein [Archangium minus]|uniref:Carbohydrate binding family 9 domain-containing protein n=1 Tax=Archangium minus TaxID=83450 RepID=A0ABY9X5U5_9BACT|nr:carbohydrate binding family 9 domain-containing protein [Archangium minus]